MAGKKGEKKKPNRTTQVTSKFSSAASLSVSAATSQVNASIIHKAAFAPSVFQLSLFASVIQGLNGHQLRVHDTVSGQLQCQHDFQRTRITALDWGYHGDSPRLPDHPSSKKKRRLEETNGGGAGRGVVILGLGTSQSDIQLFSPTDAKVLGVLKGGHTSSVKDFKFTNHGLNGEAWSLGDDRKLVQWNLHDQTASRSIEAPISPPSTLLPFPSAILVASHDTWLVDLDSDEDTTQIGTGASPVHTILASMSPDSRDKPTQYLTAAQNERQVVVYDFSGETPTMLILNATGEIESLALQQPASHSIGNKPRALAALTKRGELEVFADPFVVASSAVNGASDPKTKMKNRTRRPKSTITIKYVDSKSTLLPLVGACFHDDDLVLACVESGGHVSFERVQWRNSEADELILNGNVVIAKARSLVGVENATRVGSKLLGQTQVDESNAVVSYGTADNADTMAVDQAEPIEISSAEEESESDDDESLPNGINAADTTMKDAHSNESEDESDEERSRDGAAEPVDSEPTFGDLIHSNASGPVDVTASLAKSHDQSVVPYGREGSRLPSGLTLSNVLAQALRTNDESMLESCFHETDLNVVRATIERLDSSLATELLQRLAGKLHSRPGRAGSLMVWIQWTLVAHGGYLGSQPETVRKLAGLQRVVKERASSLQPLLSLKGKLDMLEAQMNLRRSMLSRIGRDSPAAEEDDEAAVVYVEGQDDSNSDASSSNEDEEEDDVDDDDDDTRDRLSLGSGSGTSDSGSERPIDDEASETADSEEGEFEEEVDYEDVDSDDEDEGAPSSKVKLPNGIGK